MYAIAMRALIKTQLHSRLVDRMRRLYHHEVIAALVFRALASNSNNPIDRQHYLQLARLSDRKALHCARQLSLLRPAKMPGRESHQDAAWRKLLLDCNAPRAVRRIAGMEHKDRRQLDSLFDALAAWR